MGGAAGAARLQGGSRAEGGGRVVLVGAQREAWRGGGAPWRPAKAEEVPAKSTGLFAGKVPAKSTCVEERRRRALTRIFRIPHFPTLAVGTSDELLEGLFAQRLVYVPF